MIELLLAHRFSYGALAFAVLLGYTLGVTTVLGAAWWMWCRNPRKEKSC